MSLKGLFGLFGMPEDDGDDDKIRRELDESLDVFKDTPYFKVGMFCKMINNGSNFTKQLLNFFKTSDDHIAMSGVGEVGEIMMYNRALSWIQDCDLDKDEWKLAFHDHKEKDILKCIIKSIEYYEKIEEYETCAFLKKIQNCIEEIYP